MDYNLTVKEQECLRWLVAQTKAERIAKVFNIAVQEFIASPNYEDSIQVRLRNSYRDPYTFSDPKTLKVPGMTAVMLENLQLEGFIQNVSAYVSNEGEEGMITWGRQQFKSYCLTQKAFDAVENNFVLPQMEPIDSFPLVEKTLESSFLPNWILDTLLLIIPIAIGVIFTIVILPVSPDTAKDNIWWLVPLVIILILLLPFILWLKTGNNNSD